MAVAAVSAAPLITVVVLAVFPDQGDTVGRLWATVMPGYIFTTLKLSAGVAAGTLILGVTTAWLVTAFEFPGRRLLSWSLIMPMAMPGYVIAIVYIELLDFAGPVQTAIRRMFGWQYATDYYFPRITSLGGAICLLSLVLYPYVYLLARTAFGRQSARLIEAGRVLNLSFNRCFFRLVLPMARPAIAVGLILVIMETVGDFGLVQLFAVNTLTVGIYVTWFGAYNVTAAARLALGLLILVVLLVVLEQGARGRRRYSEIKGDGRALPRRQLKGWRAWMAGGWCFLPVFGGIGLPLGLQLGWLTSALADARLATFARDAAHSVLLAVLSAGSALLGGIVLAYGQRLAPVVLIKSMVRIAASGYALPGPVIALGVLLPLAALDRALMGAAGELFHIEISYLLSGSIFILIFAYTVRFMALAFGAVEAGLARISPNLDAAARTLNQTVTATLRRVHLPLMRGSMLTALLLVMVDVMKELPVTLMLQPFNFSTLATRTFSYASEEMYRQASLWAVAIVAVGLVPVMVLNRRLLLSLDGSDRAYPS
jgi:iron(III) transport system permease protein